MSEKQPYDDSRQRIDKWLFFARMAKSRSIAQGHIGSGHVSINGKRVTQASHMVKAGDRIELSFGPRNLVLVVRGAGERRGPYEEAKLLYDDLTPAPDPAARRLTPLEQALRAPGSGRPTKKERRDMDKMLFISDMDTD